MLDWSVYEVENIGWDSLQEIDDHIVPHPGGEPANENVAQGDFHKENNHEVAISVGGSKDRNTSIDKHILQVKEKAMVHSSLKHGKVPMLEKHSCSHIHDDAFPASYDSASVSSGNGFPFEDNKIPDSCFKRRKVASVGSGFSADDCILGSRDVVADRNFCFQLDDISPAGSDLNFYGNEHGEKDILDCGLPDIGNFEDIDRMFRNSDSTFGQENAGAMDGNKLSFFPTTSNSLEDNDDAFRSGTRSPCSDSSALKITTKHHKANMKFMLGIDAPLISDFFDEKSGSCACKSSSWRPDDDEPCHMGYCNHANCSDVMAESAHGKKPDEETSMDEVKESPLYQAKKATGGTRFQRASVKKSYQIQDVRSDNGAEEVRLELPLAETDSSTAQESSYLNFVLSDGLSLEAMSFRQFLDVTEQLDVKTKLCIRDSLYRLAMSAEERHNSGGTSSGSSNSRTGGVTPSAEETNMSVGLMDVETKTNHIDRSMVHLLFYGPIEPWKKPSNGPPSRITYHSKLPHKICSLNCSFYYV